MKASRKTRRAAGQLYRRCLVDGLLDPGRVRLVAERLASSRQRGSLPILTGFHRLVRLDQERHSAVVETAAPLPASLRDTIQSRLAGRYGPGIQTSFREIPELIAGMRVRVGSDLYDDSVRARLAAIAARL